MLARILNLLPWRRERLERDLDRELRDHVERRVVDLLKDGANEDAARRQAHVELGGVSQVREDVRETWTLRWLDAFAADARYAMRGLVKHWGFSSGAVAVLGLSVGATTAIFSIVNTVLLEPLDYPDADRIVSIGTFRTNTGRASPDVSGPDFLDWQAQNDVFERMAVSYGGDDFAAIVSDRAVFANARYVSAEFFAVFGQTASAGRLIAARDVPARGAEPTVVVVAHRWATTHFGNAQAAVGKTITVYGNRLQIIGVAAPEFRYPDGADLWAPWLTINGGTDRSLHNYQAVGKLAPGVDLARASAQMRAIGDDLARRYPENRLKSVRLMSLHERVTGNLHATLFMLMCAVVVVWLIACANIASLLIARAAGRSREIALRAALGAGRGRVVRQLLTESCVLAGVGGLAGLLVASLLVRAFVALSPADLPRIHDVQIDMAVVLFALALSFASTVLFGVVPALHGSRFDLAEALKQGGSKATVSRTSARLRSFLVVTEVALSMILLAAAGLLVQSFRALQHVDLGFTTSRVLVAYTDYAVNSDEEIRNRSRVYADLLDRLRSVPGVSAAGGIAFLPMGREPRPARDYFIRGRPEGAAGERPQAEPYAITPDYFKTLGIPLRAGRDFDRTDTPERPPVAIINETLARAAFPGESPLSHHIRTNTNSPWMEIVGVVGDTRWQDPSHAPPSVLFVASLQGAGKSLSIVARTSLDEQALAGTLRALLHEANPTVPVRFETMEELFDFALAYPRFRTRIIALFAGASALLAAVGIFSVLAYLVGQRTRELAVRRALGAPTVDVIRLIVSQGMRLVAIGLALGLAGTLAISRLLAGFLFETGPWDVGVYLGTIAVLSGAGLLATLVPSIRAATIAPGIVLRQE